MTTAIYNPISERYVTGEDPASLRDMFISLFDWNCRANEEFILTFEKNVGIPPVAFKIFMHMMNIHEQWVNRITNVQIPKKEASKPSTIDLPLENFNIHSVTRELLESESYGANLQWTFQYVNHEGTTLESTLMDTYFHILSHSAYHRGQIGYILREKDVTVPETNFAALKNTLHYL